MTKLTIPLTKVCGKCKSEKPITEFWKDRGGKHGLARFCIECGKSVNKHHSLRRSLAPKPQITKQRCQSCKTLKDASEYWSNKTTPTGLNNQCKACINTRNRLPHVREQRRRLKQKSYRNGGHRTYKNSWLRRQYGITLAEYEAMSERQSHLCAICHQPQVPGFSLAVDHDHATGKVRGLLCSFCNQALGIFRDSIEVLTSAIEYLRNHKT